MPHLRLTSPCFTADMKHQHSPAGSSKPLSCDDGSDPAQCPVPGQAWAGHKLAPLPAPGFPLPQVHSWVPLPLSDEGRGKGNPESLSTPRTAQSWLPAPGWQEGILTFLKPGQVEGAGDVDGGAGAPVGPAGVHVKCPVTEHPCQGQGQGKPMVRCWWHRRIKPCYPSTSEGTDATLKWARVPHTSLSPPGHPSPGYPI